MANKVREFRAQYLTGATAAAAATGYVTSDNPNNAFLLLNVFANGGGTITVALSSGTATGAAGTAVTSLSTAATGLTWWRLPADRLQRYVYASSSGSAGAPVYTTTLEVLDLLDSSAGTIANRFLETN